MATIIKVTLREGESAENLLKRYKQQVKKEDLIYELRRREYYKTPAEKRKEKHEHAQRKLKRKHSRVKNY